MLSRFDAGEFDVAKIFFSEFGSIVNQVPTELQVIPAKFDSAVDEGTSMITSLVKKAFLLICYRVLLQLKFLLPC